MEKHVGGKGTMLQLTAKLALTRQELAHLWAGGILSVRIEGQGAETALELTYQEAEPTTGSRILYRRIGAEESA